ncbi:MAG: hypothetical protein LBV31_00860, partial [Prevotellaceae bacterium]|nr:hypothetical protein [Prevotellaceae bacterium]
HDKYLQLSVGLNAYSGDIGGFGTGKGLLDQWNLASPRPLVSLGYKYALSNRWAIKGLASAVLLAGNSDNVDVKYRPFLHRWFNTTMFEIGANVEYAFLKGSEGINQLYILAGAGVSLGTAVKLYSEDDTLLKAGEEGDLNPPVAPFGSIGLGWQHDFQRWAMGVELFGQYHLSDFLDGVRFVKTDVNDMLLGINFIFSYNFKKSKTCNCDW